MKRYGQCSTEKGWRFSTGSQEWIDKKIKKKQASATAIRGMRRAEQLAITGGIIIASPEGKPSKYFYRIKMLCCAKE